MTKYGFIGLGNMAGAIIAGMIGHGFEGGDILGYNRSPGKTQKLAERYDILPLDGVSALAQRADVIVLAVKPQMLPEVLPQLKPCLGPEKLTVSIAAGKELSYYNEQLGKVPLVRAMPNINAIAGAAITALAAGEDVSAEQKRLAAGLFSTVGSVCELPERLFPIFGAVGGASVAFAYLYIDALARAAVREGMPKPQALEVAAEAVRGSAELVLKMRQEGVHPMELVDRVCSPGGTTIEGILSLQQDGFEGAVQHAVAAVVEKDRRIARG